MGKARQVVEEPLLAAGPNNCQPPANGASHSYHTLMNHKHQLKHHHYHRTSKMKTPTKSTKFWTLSFISLLVLGLLAWALYCRLGVVDQRPSFSSHLKLVSLLIRHADRAPSDPLPPHDRHSERPLFFWPNGLTNLTDTGRLRAYRTGLALRSQYADFLDYSPHSVLAFSSPIGRCLESCHHLLRGLYDTGRSMEEARDFFGHLNRCQRQNTRLHYDDKEDHCSTHIPRGAGGQGEWRNIVIDSESLPSLSSRHLSGCRVLANQSIAVDEDAMQLTSVSQLEGINLLEKELRERYNYTGLSFSALTVWSTVKSELELARTSASLGYTDHFQPWIHLEASRLISNSGGGGAHVISLFDVLERVSVVAARERLAGLRSRLTAGPILQSIVRSQSVALGGAPVGPIEERYRDRKLVVYYSHDTIIQLLLWRLGVCHDESHESYYENQFHRLLSPSSSSSCDTRANHQEAAHPDQELAPFLAGLKMSNYGLSVELELWEHVHLEEADKKFHTIQMNIYNRDDGKFRPIDHRPIAFGSVCRRLFLEKYPNANLAPFYQDSHFKQLDKSLNCPLSLFRNLTGDLLMDPATHKQLCGT